MPSASAVITHVTPHTRYTGEYPVTPLQDGAHGDFTVNVTTHLRAPPSGSTGSLVVVGSWANANANGDGDGKGSNTVVASSGPVSLPSGDSAISLQLTASAAQIKLWWPAGVGDQPLYNVTATWTTTTTQTQTRVSSAANNVAGGRGGASISATRRFGFRVFALVTINDTDATYVWSASLI